MNCIHCCGAMQHATAPLYVDRNGYHLAFADVPAWVCGQCGEFFSKEREIHAIQGATRVLDECTRQLVADVSQG